MTIFRRRSDATAHWSKDFVEHLRTVHFALIALAVVAIISGRSPDIEKMRKAKSQLQTIRDFFEHSVPNDREQRYGAKQSMVYWWLVDDRRKRAAFLPFMVEVVVADSCPNTYYQTTLDDFERVLLENKTSSLDWFEIAWNHLQCSTIESYYQPDWSRIPPRSKGDSFSLEMAGPKDLRKRNVEIAPLINLFPPPIEPSRPRDVWSEGQREGLNATLYFEGGLQAWALHKRDHLISIRIADRDRDEMALLASDAHPGSDLLKHFESSWMCKNVYAECFRDLKDVAAGKENYTLKDLSQWLDDELAHIEPRQIEVFGIKFPAGTQFQWGIILIVVVQLYFWLHLRELSPRLEGDHPGLDVAWPGLYPSWVAYAVVWVSVVGVPLYALWILGLNFTNYRPPLRPFLRSNWLGVTLWLAIPVAVYAILSVWSCLTLRRLALLAAAARQEDESKPAEQKAASTAKAGSE